MAFDTFYILLAIKTYMDKEKYNLFCHWDGVKEYCTKSYLFSSFVLFRIEPFKVICYKSI